MKTFERLYFSIITLFSAPAVGQNKRQEGLKINLQKTELRNQPPTDLVIYVLIFA